MNKDIVADWPLFSPTRSGLRSGYVELVNVDPAVMKYIYKLFSTDSCAPVLGQLALDVMINPPQPGAPSYPLYNVVRREIHTVLKPASLLIIMLGTSLMILLVLAFNSLLQETRNIESAVANNVKRAHEVVNSLPGICCQPVQGGAFAFPRLYLPLKAIQKAKVTTLCLIEASVLQRHSH